MNYETAQAALETTKATSTKRPHEADCRDIITNPVRLVKKRNV